MKARWRQQWRRWSFQKTLRKRLPILGWAREYSRSMLLGDTVAGISVGLMTVPQALAYSIVAGLPPNYGLYSAFMGSFVYMVFGTTQHLCIGPTAVMALITKHYSSHGGPDYAVLLAFVSGILELMAAVVNLGFLVNFISHPVISGFCSAAAVTIISSQVKALLGLSLQTHGVIDVWVQVAHNITSTRIPDLLLGLTCILLLTFLKNLGTMKCPCCHRNSKTATRPIENINNITSTTNGCTITNTSTTNTNSNGISTTNTNTNSTNITNNISKSTTVEQNSKCRKNAVFVITVGRNAIVVILASLLAFALAGMEWFTLTGFVEPGLPQFGVPPITPAVGNTTLSFVEAMEDIGVGVVVVPFIAILDNIAIIQAVYPGRAIDNSQEIAALGLVNLFGSFFRSMPTTGSLSRTAVSKSSGGRSPASGIITGAMVLLALAFLTPAFRWIPRASLAAVIMCAVVHMVDVGLAVTLWRVCKKDLLVLGVTFVSCLVWGVEWGVMIGAVLNLFLLLFTMARPSLKVDLCQTATGSEYVVLQPGYGIQYPSISHVRARVESVGRKRGKGTIPVLLDCCHLHHADYTAAEGLVSLSKDFHERGQTLVFFNMATGIRESVLTLRGDTASFPLHIGGTVGHGDLLALPSQDLDSFTSGVNVEETALPVLNGGHALPNEQHVPLLPVKLVNLTQRMSNGNCSNNLDGLVRLSFTDSPDPLVHHPNDGVHNLGTEVHHADVGVHCANNLDGLVRSSSCCTNSLDSLVHHPDDGVHNLSTEVHNGDVVTHNLDILTHNPDALTQKPDTSTHDMDSLESPCSTVTPPSFLSVGNLTAANCSTTDEQETLLTRS